MSKHGNDGAASRRLKDKNFQVHHGMNSRDALRVARKLGCGERRKGGEIILFHATLNRRQVIEDPTRRKDASRAFTSFLLAILEAMQTDAA